MKSNCLTRSQSFPRAVYTASTILMCMAAAFVSAPMSAGPPIGINILYAGDYTPDLLFADAFKQSRSWNTSSGSSASVDSNGWPVLDANIYVWAGQTLNMSGTYALSFNGQATVTVTLGGGTISNQTYDSSSNRTTATLAMTNADLLLSFTNTQRTSSSATNTGITNVKLMRPTSYGASTSYPVTANFTTLIKGLINGFGTIRFMDYLATNANAQVNWSDRIPPTYATCVVSDANYGWQGKGSPWEYTAILCNETGKDMWICIPAGATDAYITNVANLIAFGSDGTNPYTSTQANPAYPPLNPSLKVYVEYSNEVWNTAGAFTQSAMNHNAAISEVNGGGSPLNFDGDTSDSNWAARRTAKRTVEISNIFRNVFGNAAMMVRVRPVLESQEGYVAFWLLQQTHMLEDYYNNPNRVATPHPPGYFIYGGGGSAYFNPDNGSATLSLSNIWTSDTFDNAVWAPICQNDSNYDLPVYGKRVAYEGGPSMDNTGHSESIKSQAWSDPGMTTSVSSHQTTWDQNGGDLLCYFDSTGDYQWGFTHDPAVLNTPKLLAIDSINSSARATGNYGVAIPGTLIASAYNSPESWAGSDPHNLSANGNWTWTGYVVKNASSGAFSIKLNAGSSGAANKADIYVDGSLVGTITIPNTGSNGTYQDSATLTCGTLAAGTHGVLLKASSGNFGVNTIGILASTSAAPMFTIQPISVAVTGGTVALGAVASNAPSYQWMLNGTTPVPGATGPILLLANADAAVGSYTCVATNGAGSATSDAATVSVVTTSTPGHLVNISCRALSGTGANQLITGFVVGGGGTSGSQTVLIRASGPALVPFGVTDTLPDPQLTLNNSSGVLETNNSWGGNALISSTATSVGAFAWVTLSSHDSAFLESLTGGAYTAQVTGSSGDTGVALAEIYDATSSYTLTQPRLINISARVQVGTGGNALIAGFVIGGSTSKTVLIRASGPALIPFGVQGTLRDPELQLYSTASGSSLLATNVGWGGDPQLSVAAASVGAFSWGSLSTPDSAILVTLPPGPYTANVSGASGDTGVALVEVYEVQ